MYLVTNSSVESRKMPKLPLYGKSRERMRKDEEQKQKERRRGVYLGGVTGVISRGDGTS